MSEKVTKLVPRWYLTFAKQYPYGGWQPELLMFDNYEQAIKLKKSYEQAAHLSCIEVTGPHYHRVPA